jgi:branched-chain amino acid transport system permease protein/neutral amino acid transport system permease protein
VVDHLVHLSVTGVLIASLLALAAVGLSLSFGVARFANVAHPDFMMVGAYATFAYNVLLGWSFWIAAALGIATALLLGVAVAWVAFDKLPVSGNVQLLIVSIGVSFILRHVALLIFGPTPAQFAVPLQRPWVWGPVRLTPYQVATLVIAAALILGVHLLLTRTRLGRILRAMADNPTLCQVSGVDVDRARLAMWGIVVLLGAVAGILFGLNLVLQPNMGWDLIIPIFAAVILGGIGSPYGALAGAVTLGVALEWSTLVIPFQYKEMVAFGVMALCLLLRPRGLFGGR